MNKTIRAGLIVVAFGAALALAAPALAQPEAEAQSAAEQELPLDDMEIYRELNLFGEIFDRIREEYVDVPNERVLIRAAIQGMLSSLDPHSGYLSPELYSDMRFDTEGRFGGLGIEVTMEEGVLKVVSPIDDTPASRAGILANDFIIEINGEQIGGLALDEAVDLMRGEIGTEISVTIYRDGVRRPLEFTLVRAQIALSVVREFIERDVGVIRLAQFSEQAYTGLEKSIRKIQEELGDDLKGLVLDLRNNPGGLVDQAILVTDAFLNRGNILSTRGRAENETDRYDARADDLDSAIADVPLIVLINGGSASAAEIVAGALQDQRRASLVGTRSFGKGSVQSVISLGVDGAMRLTTSRYYTPSGRSIQASGIVPDIEIFQEVPEVFDGRDEIIGEAGLRGQIGGGTNGEATTGSSVFVPADREMDTQLNYAIDLLNNVVTNEAFPPEQTG
ncbi:MAG: S41 family peptidase [Alphaproteobacteria bacterium]|nr:S41 family peptidase [Alphaproteobacteria bacterium]